MVGSFFLRRSLQPPRGFLHGAAKMERSLQLVSPSAVPATDKAQDRRLHRQVRQEKAAQQYKSLLRGPPRKPRTRSPLLSGMF